MRTTHSKLKIKQPLGGKSDTVSNTLKTSNAISMASFESDSEDEYTSSDAISYFPITEPSESFSTLIAALQHDKNRGFDFLEFLPDPQSGDFYEKTIILINKCRTYMELQKGFDDQTLEGLQEFIRISREDDEEKYFKPTLPDDSYLMYIDDLEDLLISNTSAPSQNVTENKALSEIKNDMSENVQLLQMKIHALTEQLAKSKEIMASMIQISDDAQDQNEKSNKQDNDGYYFSSYSHSGIHEIMLQDQVRTEAYQNAILKNPHLFKDKIVMDIGCGTGILSLFAAKAGALKVIAIDASNVHKEAREIVELNGFGHVITVVHGKVEDLILNNQLPLKIGEKVNVVISEWMGYALFFETMLPSVMKVRDLFMDHSEGTMWPNKCSILLEGASDDRLDYWSDVYGFDMGPMRRRVIHELCKEASVEVVPDENVNTDRVMIQAWDLNSCVDKDLDFDVPFLLKQPAGVAVPRVDKLVVSFDINFDFRGTTPISFSTGCQTTPTHWKQTTLWFDPEYKTPILDNGKVLRGKFYMGRNENNPRDMDFLVRWEVGYFLEEIFVKEYDGIIKSKLSA